MVVEVLVAAEAFHSVLSAAPLTVRFTKQREAMARPVAGLLPPPLPPAPPPARRVPLPGSADGVHADPNDPSQHVRGPSPVGSDSPQPIDVDTAATGVSGGAQSRHSADDGGSSVGRAPSSLGRASVSAVDCARPRAVVTARPKPRGSRCASSACRSSSAPRGLGERFHAGCRPASPPLVCQADGQWRSGQHRVKRFQTVMPKTVLPETVLRLPH